MLYSVKTVLSKMWGYCVPRPAPGNAVDFDAKTPQSTSEHLGDVALSLALTRLQASLHVCLLQVALL